MRRSICYCEPKTAFAGQVATWGFFYTCSSDLPKGAQLKFDLKTKDKKNDWEMPLTDSKSKGNIIWAVMPNNKTIKAKQLKDQTFEFILPGEIKTGEKLSIFIGNQGKSKKESGNRCQLNAQRKREFLLYIDPKGKGSYQEPEIFHIDVRGNVLKNIKIIAPSLVSKNHRFDVTVRFEDEYSNLTSYAPEGTLIELTYENLRDNLKWKLFVPETGFTTLPNLYFNEAGIYRIQLRNCKNQEIFTSAPIKCLDEYNLNLLWGILHGEAEKERLDSFENSLKYFRDELALDFYATSFSCNEEEFSADTWKNINLQISEFSEDERFVVFAGFQYNGTPKEEGLKLLLNTKENKPIIKKKETKNSSIKKIFKSYQPKDLISIPLSPMLKETPFDFSELNSEYEKVVEIYSAWGSSENQKKEGNIYPFAIEKNTQEFSDGSITKALLSNKRFGFVAGGFDTKGPFSKLIEKEYNLYSQGITALLAKEHTREALIEALQSKRSYATTGARIVLGFEIVQQPMGSELSTENKPGLILNRHIASYAIGTAPLKEVQVIRNGKILKSFKPEKNDFEFTIDDDDNLFDIAIKPKDDKPPFVFYYLRALQKDGHIAWSSPIWIDYIPVKSIVVKKKKFLFG